jgi:protease-4
VGSIGIYAGKFNAAKLYDKLGLKNEFEGRGQNSGLFSVLKPWTEQEKDIIHRIIKNFYVNFVEKTANARKLSYDQVDKLGRGRVYTGSAAASNKLCDAEGYFYTAVQAAKQMAGIDPDESVRLIYYPKEKSLLSQILNEFSAKITFLNKLNEYQAIQMVNFIEELQNRPLALLPFRISWK